MRILTILSILILCLTGCSKLPKFSDIFPDKRTTYQKAKIRTQALEIPPDLVDTSTINDVMSLPNESVSLSEFKNNQETLKSANGNRQLGSELDISLNQNKTVVWQEIEAFFKQQGYSFRVNDVELGVIETNFNQSLDTDQHKYILFVDSVGDSTSISLSAERQVRSGDDWIDSDDSDLILNMARLLEAHFANIGLLDTKI